MLRAQLPTGVRWVDPNGIHLTLKLLGNFVPDQAEDILEVMGRHAASVEPFSICLSGLGMFPNPKRPRVVWAGIEGELDSLQNIQAELEEATWGLGFAKEKRPFSPHLTLGRVREQVSDSERRRIGTVVSSTCLGTSEPWPVEAGPPDTQPFGSGGSHVLRVGVGSTWYRLTPDASFPRQASEATQARQGTPWTNHQQL